MNSDTADLPHVLDGQRRELRDPDIGLVSFYYRGPDINMDTHAASATPLLLVHSINAAASAHEVRPLFDACSSHRPVYAIDLPGYGFSERSDRPYLPRLMVDALHALIALMRSEWNDRPVDGLAVSLSCEFLARAANETPASIRSLALVSSTGLNRRTPRQAPPESNRGRPSVYRVLNLPVLGRALFRGLTTRPSIRFFLQKTFGSKRIDERLFEDSCRMVRHPGAHHAPFHFLSGYLFSADIRQVLQALAQPVWLSHGVRGDFVDFSGAEDLSRKPNWRVTAFRTGALPYFEVPGPFLEAYEDFIGDARAERPVNRSDQRDS